MAGKADAGEAGPVEPASRAGDDDLLLLAVSRPGDALIRARAVLARQPSAYQASVAHQAAGIVLREYGDVNAGIRELRTGLRLARRAGLAERETDMLATLGVGLVYAGQTAAGLAAFDQAVQRSTGVLTGRVLHRRGIVLWTLGHHAAALEDFRLAISVLQRASDLVWMARALSARGLVHVSMGSPVRADADFVAAERLFTQTNQDLASIHNVVNRGLCAFALGDLPTALSHLNEAASRYRPLNLPTPGLSIDRCAVLLAAGLTGEALAEADAAVRDIERVHGRSTKKAELLLTAASCALAATEPQTAIDWAMAASRLFRSQRSPWWQAHAAGVLVEAKYAAGMTSAELLREANRAAAALEASASNAAARAHLLAGRVALELGQRSAADRHFADAAQSRHRGAALSRACGWLSEALRAEAAGDTRRLLAACRRGLDVLDEHRLTLGASELRAQATSHGSELAMLALSYASRAGRPRLMLTWSERWRATAHAVPPVRPLANAELNAGLTALRDVMRRLEESRQGTPSPAAQRERQRLEREQHRLEGEVRTFSLLTPGVGSPGRTAINVRALLDQLGDAKLVEIVEVDGVLQVLICGAGKVRRFAAGRAPDAAQAAAFARFALRRLARYQPGDDPGSALAILRRAGPKLQDALLGQAAGHIGDQPVVVVPPGKLHAIPWTLIPALSEQVVSVAPSAGAWMRARAAAPPSHRRVLLTRGPGLLTEGAEVPPIAQLYEDVTVLAGSGATTRNVLSAIDGAWLAHIAAHGSFRSDSPLFSSLRMHDGPLTVYDFEQLRRAPYRLVLPSCDSGMLAPAGANELLGLVTSLLPLGTAGIIAAIVQLNDYAVVPVMLDLHRYLRAGQTLAEAMRSVRYGLGGDPIREATAASLVALGAG